MAFLLLLLSLTAVTATEVHGADGPVKRVMFDNPGVSVTTVFEAKGVVTSPLYPKQYPPNSFERTSIRVPFGYDIRLHLTFMDIQSCANCTCDYLLIDGVPGRFCGMNNPDRSFFFIPHYTAAYLNILFHSDDGLEGGGFSLEYEASAPLQTPPGPTTTAPLSTICPPVTCPTCPSNQIQSHESDGLCYTCKCRDIPNIANPTTASLAPSLPVTQPTPTLTPASTGSTSTKGVIQSPLYPSTYPPNQHHDTKVYVPQGYDVLFTLTFLDIQACTLCSCDYLQIDVIGDRICGDQINADAQFPVKRYTGGYIHVIFHSDQGLEGRGFVLEYEISAPGTSAPPTTTPCPAHPTCPLLCPHGYAYDHNNGCTTCRCAVDNTVTTPCPQAICPSDCLSGFQYIQRTPCWECECKPPITEGTSAPPETTLPPSTPTPQTVTAATFSPALSNSQLLQILMNLEHKSEMLEAAAKNMREDINFFLGLLTGATKPQRRD